MKKILSKGLLSQALVFLGTALLVSGGATAAIEIDQQPLLVAKPVPGNMAIIGSFEFPTMVTKAYNTSSYSHSTTTDYVGYFNSNRCYEYNFHTDEKKRHFSPINKTGINCSGEKEWSGHFLNWASMQSIDIFRHILTGGHRFVDEVGETWLEKGVQTGQGSSGSNFPDGSISGKNTIKNIIPESDWSSLKTRIGRGNSAMGNKLQFTKSSFSYSKAVIPYNPEVHDDDFLEDNSGRVFEVSIRVKVCDPSMLESNCLKYSENNFKPVGLIQEYSDTMRYSAFGYLNDNSDGINNKNRSGGIMHARMKYVGPKRTTSDNKEATNLNNEWDAETGIFVLNPDPADASATPHGTKPIVHSGVISYINRSGHIVPETEFKRYDNVSELYYTAYRYLKGLENISAYTNVSGVSGDARDRLIGGLPIISEWKKDGHDPIQFSCQKNFFLGIGDTNTHNDKGIKTDAADDPVFSSTFDTLRNVIHAREGMDNNSVKGSGTGSDYISVLAYDAKTNDLRPDMPGKQRASTYWIDILETGLKARKNNAYWLAAKYGGLKVADDFDPTNSSSTLEDSSWWTTGEKLSNNDKRPDNFYVVNNAQDMVNSLVQAFADIQLEQRGNRSSLALNSTQLEAGSMTFQAQYVSGAWTGDVYGYEIDKTTGSIITEPKWKAESKLPLWSQRKIYVNFDDSAELKLFSAEGKNLAGFNQDRVDYLRGKRNKEQDGTFRTRYGLLGDIINSQPVYAGKPRVDLFAGRNFPGQSTYKAWATGINRDPVVYVGGNDGMLHGFNAETGVEVFAFIPKTVAANGLSELADKSYFHRYYVDGEMTIADVYVGGSWKTVLIGTLGAGGISKDRESTNNAIFALDITDPHSVKLLWEKNSADIPALGINLGKPVIIQDAANNWKVVLGNGPNSSEGKAHLISINVANGNISSPQLSSATDNGLSAVRAWDSDGDGLTDTLYAGDLQGGVWKITDLTSTPTSTKLFTAKDKNNVVQPITATPLVGKSPYDKTTWLFVGTGQYLNMDDIANKQLQSWYGIKDNGTNGKLRASLLERKILQEVAVTAADGNRTARIIEEGTREDLVDKEGWYIDLYRIANNAYENAGERMITQNQFQGSALISNTRIPDASDPCAPSGLGMIMSINPFTGARLSDNYFDVDGNRTINNADLIMIDGVPTVVSGIGFDTGFSNPSFLGDKMYVPSDDGTVREIDIQPYSSIVGRTSWRELLNTED